MTIDKFHYFNLKINDIYNKSGASGLIKFLKSKLENIKYKKTYKYFYLEKGEQKTICGNQAYVDLIFKYLRNQYLKNKLKNWLKSVVCKEKNNIVNDKDLLLETFKVDQDNLSIKCNGKLFRFSEDDLKNILTSNLENTMSNFIPNPITPKNPYLSDYSFNTYQLDIIYKYLETKNKLTDSIKLFKMVNYNLEEFSQNNQVYLKKRIVKSNCKDLNARQIIIKFYSLLKFLKINNKNSVNFTYLFLNRNNVHNQQGTFIHDNLDRFRSILAVYLYLIYYGIEIGYTMDYHDDIPVVSPIYYLVDKLRSKTNNILEEYNSYHKNCRKCYYRNSTKDSVFVFKSVSKKNKKINSENNKLAKLNCKYMFSFTEFLTYDTNEIGGCQENLDEIKWTGYDFMIKQRCIRPEHFEDDYINLFIKTFSKLNTSYNIDLEQNTEDSRENIPEPLLLAIYKKKMEQKDQPVQSELKKINCSSK